MKEIARWHLVSAEFARALGLHDVPLSRLRQPAAKPDDPNESAADKAKKERESDTLLKSVELQDIDANLSVRSKKPIPLTVTTPSVRGTVTMAPDAIVGLAAGGLVPAGERPRSRPGLLRPGGLHAISLDGVNFDSVDLTVGSATKATTGDIHIERLTDSFLSIDALYPPRPQTLNARIARAVAHDIHWDLAPKPPKKGP